MLDDGLITQKDFEQKKKTNFGVVIVILLFYPVKIGRF
ncbi:MAG: hypothetical protein E7373_02585 [Clostridiales bacterium]|nr:hypothetical protein [Clostridiales bacterium]